MVQERKDALTGALREAVLVSAADATRLGLADGARILLRSAYGELGGTVLIAPVKPGNVQAHWPEANVLIERGVRSCEAGIPDYNAWVEIHPRPGPAPK